MRRGWLLALGLCLISFLAGAWISAAVFERVPHLEDEVAFLFQARTIAEGRLVAPAPAHPEFFAAPFIIVRDGMWFGKYPPGYPAVLALGVLVGQPWLVNAAAAALSVGLTYLAGRRLYGERVGLLAAALLTISPLFLLHSGALLSHVVCLVWALAALLCFHASQTRRSGWAALGVGLALGALFLSRPLTAVGVGLPLAVWHAVDLARLRWRGRHILAAALGFAPALAGFLAYNRMTTGSAFKTGYELWWPHDKVGFGPGLDSDGYYALSEGLDHAWFNIQQLANYLYGWPLFLSLAPAGVGLALALVALVQSRAGGLPSPPDPLSRKQERGNSEQASCQQARENHGPASRTPGALAAWIAFCHPAPIAVVLLAATGFAAAAVQGWPPPARLGPFLLALLLTQLAISFHNDYCDRALDARAKPWRALPRGLIAPRTALGWSLGLLAAGLLTAGLLGPWVAALVALGSGAGFAYNAWLKRSAWTWLPFWIGLPALPLCAFLVVDRFDPRLWLVYPIGLPLVVAIYLADTLDDIETDAALGVRGLAHRLGPRGARLTCWTAVALGHGLVWLTDPAPGPLAALSIGLLAVAILLDRRGLRHGHWLAIMAGVVTLAVGWLTGIVRET
jgi:4-hydroxybenzoate polyprenyltransferase